MEFLSKFYKTSSTQRVLFGIITSIILAYIVSLCFSYIGAIFNSMSYEEFMAKSKSATLNLHSPGLIRYMFFAQSISIFMVPALVMTKVLEVKIFPYWNLHTLPSRFFMFIVLQIIVFNIPGMNLWSSINTRFISIFIDETSAISQLYEHNKKLTDFLLFTPHFHDLLINIVLMAILPAICEELFFRGMMQRYATRLFKNSNASILITAMIFSLMHGDVYNFIPRFCMGIIFGYLYEYTQNLWVPIIAHFTHNAIVVLFYYFIQKNFVVYNFDKIGEIGNGLVFGIASVLLVSFFMIFLINNQSNVNLSEKSSNRESE